MAPAPSPDDIEQITWWMQNWQYFMAGLASLAGTVYVVRKGKDVPVIVPLSETHIDNKMELCANDLKEEIREEMKDELKVLKSDMKDNLKENKNDMLREIELMIKASKL